MRTYLLKRVLKLMVGDQGFLCTIYRATKYLRLLTLSILTFSPNMSFLVRLISDNFRSLENLELGAPSSPDTPKKKLSARGPSYCFWLYLRVRFDFPSSINFRNISGFPNWGPITLIMGHPSRSRVVLLDSMDMISY